MNTRIDFVNECQLLGITLSNNILDNNVHSAVMKLNRKSNELRAEFNLLPCNVKSQLFTTFCLDAYGSQIWNFDSNMVDPYFIAWRKSIRMLWSLPLRSHCNLLPSSLNSNNNVVKSITRSCILADRSVLGDNFRYLCNKFNIKYEQRFNSFNVIQHCITRYITKHIHHPEHAVIIRELCLIRDYGDPFVLTSTEISQLIEYLCTI